MQRPWGTIVLGEFEEEPGGLWGWSRVSEAERNGGGGPERKREWGGWVTVGNCGRWEASRVSYEVEGHELTYTIKGACWLCVEGPRVGKPVRRLWQ